MTLDMALDAADFPKRHVRRSVGKSEGTDQLDRDGRRHLPALVAEVERLLEDASDDVG